MHSMDQIHLFVRIKHLGINVPHNAAFPYNCSVHRTNNRKINVPQMTRTETAAFFKTVQKKLIPHTESPTFGNRKVVMLWQKSPTGSKMSNRQEKHSSNTKLVNKMGIPQLTNMYSSTTSNNSCRIESNSFRQSTQILHQQTQNTQATTKIWRYNNGRSSNYFLAKSQCGKIDGKFLQRKKKAK